MHRGPDASCLAGDEVNGPFSAYCEAKIIDQHALEATGGLHYSELDREDPLRQVASSAAFLQASLFTSVVAFGVAGMAILIGVLFILIGLGIRDVATEPLEAFSSCQVGRRAVVVSMTREPARRTDG